jgi:hypothetical protein
MMDDRMKAKAEALIERYRNLKREMKEAHQACLFHKLQYGRYPANMGAIFRAFAERGQEIHTELHNLNQLWGGQPFKGVQVPDHLPEEL